MTAPAFCPQCGTKRHGTLRYCASCGNDLGVAGESSGAALDSRRQTATEPTPPATAGSVDRSATISLIAGLAWIGAGVCFGYLAFLQLQYAPILGGQADQLRGLALGNGIGAAITLFFGARLILGASRSTLMGSAVWAGLGVAYGAWQISQSLTHEIFLLGTLLTGVAGVLGFVAAQSAPKTTDEQPLLGPGGKGLLVLIGLGIVVAVVLLLSGAQPL
jgi:hypothetical protein